MGYVGNLSLGVESGLAGFGDGCSIADSRNIGYHIGEQSGVGEAMTYIHADVIWVRRSPAGDKELELLARHDGMFEFREATATLCEHPTGPEVVMLPSYTSGLYASQTEAEADASQTIIWLKDDGTSS